MPTRAIVIGGSAGALDVLTSLLLAVPPNVALPVVVVLHLTPDSRTPLSELFAARLAVPVREVLDKAPVGPGVWFAPAGYHLLIERSRCFALSIDAPVNFSRPSIDVLFDSAARAFGDELVAILLSGASRDGVEGLRAVAAANGIILAQDPRSAASPTMPEAAVGMGALARSTEELRDLMTRLPIADRSEPRH